MNAPTVAGALQRASQRISRAHYAPFRTPRLSVQQPQRYLHARQAPPPLLRKQIPNSWIANQQRQESTTAAEPSLTNRSEDENAQSEEIAGRRAQEPAYEITFTCKKCLERSSHRITKQAYHFGTTLITCPGCKNRHLISDHLKIFSDKKVTIEDILKEKGQFLRKGRLGEDGDVEFYDESQNPAGL